LIPKLLKNTNIHPEIGFLYYYLSIAYKNILKYDLALKAGYASVEYLEKIFFKDHPYLLPILNNLCEIS
jgi:hypothetical protein